MIKDDLNHLENLARMHSQSLNYGFTFQHFDLSWLTSLLQTTFSLLHPEYTHLRPLLRRSLLLMPPLGIKVESNLYEELEQTLIRMQDFEEEHGFLLTVWPGLSIFLLHSHLINFVWHYRYKTSEGMPVVGNMACLPWTRDLYNLAVSESDCVNRLHSLIGDNPEFDPRAYLIAQRSNMPWAMEDEL